jgi:hypothetical protein
MTALDHARNDGQQILVGRMEATMETFPWLTGWNTQPPIDGEGRVVFGSYSDRATLRSTTSTSMTQ